MSTVETLEDQIRQHLRASMPDPTGLFSSMPLSDLLVRWFNWRDRFVPAQPRIVHVSNELVASPLFTVFATELAQVQAEVETGQDLTPRLSKRVSTAAESTGVQKALHRREDLDLLLSDWGIHHIHLSVAGGNELLMAVFRDRDAYFVDVLPHGKWTEIGLLEALVRNWSNENLLKASQSDIRLVRPNTPEMREVIRKAGGVLIEEIDGRLYLARMMTLAGISADVRTRADRALSAVARDEPFSNVMSILSTPWYQTRTL
jgi:hypothetical protein